MIGSSVTLTPQQLAHAVTDAALRAGGLLICTDFDGTLAPIVGEPRDAHPLPEAVVALEWLSRGGAAAADGGRIPVRLAVVTSRDAGDLAGRLPLGPEAQIVGCAGLERWVEGRSLIDPRALPYLEAIDAAGDDLAAAVSDGRLPGARLERKRCSAVLHTRGARREEVEPEAAALAHAVAARHGLRLIAAKRALELRPPVDGDKATAVMALRDGAPGHLLCVAGDDLPDVPMLRTAATGGGIAVAVADVETPDVVLEAATATVEGPWGWAATLGALAENLRAG